VSFTLCEGWMNSNLPTDSENENTFANEGCSIYTYYHDYSTGENNVPDEALTDTLLWSFANSMKNGKDLIDEQSKDFKIQGHSGYLDYLTYQDGSDVIIAVVTSFNTGKGIMNMLYYTNNTEMPFFDDYSDMISSVEIE
ncbi:MAG: hypothetical protein IJI24_02140, partial [Lachnospiraceae bacterium]|nr:hypothetical protein [Lachnospiraceae bacterium]